jgi:hypothetical protein
MTVGRLPINRSERYGAGCGHGGPRESEQTLRERSFAGRRGRLRLAPTPASGNPTQPFWPLALPSIGSMPLAVSALCSGAFERAAFRLRQDMTRTPAPHLGEAYLRTYLVRTAGLEPALSERNRFSYHFGFRRRQSAFVAWTVPSPWRLGRRRRPSSLYTFPQSRAWLGIGLGLEPVSVPRL